MNSKAPIWFVAIAALALPAAAQSAIELYGKAHVSLDAIGNGDALAGDEPVKKYGLLVTSNQSYIGLRGNERLRDRLSAIWQFEQGVDIDDGSWSDEGRDSFVGLEGGLGVLLAGRHVTPYRKLSDELDIFRDTRADHSAVIGAVDGQSLFNERARNIVYYATPEQRRIRFALAYIASRERDELPRTDEAADLNGYSATLAFVSGPLYLGIGYEKLGQIEAADQRDASAMKAVFGWDFGQGTRASLIWEQADNGQRLIGGERDAWYGSLSHVAGNFTWKLGYGVLGDLDRRSDSGAQMVALGFSYAMSPRTEFYLIGATLLNDDQSGYALHPDHDDAGSVIRPAAFGKDVSTISAGVIHRFDLGL